MLHIFRKKTPERTSRRQKVGFHTKGDMSDFHIDRKFSTIFCCDAFFHNVTVQEEINCLRCVTSHVKPGGRFLFNIPNPDLAFLLRCVDPEGNLFREQNEYPLTSGGRVRIEESCEAD